MDTGDWNKVDEIVVACTEELFAQYGVEARAEELPEGQAMERATLAVIGFAGDQMRGSLLLGADRDILVRSHPMWKASDTLDEDQLQDWSGEFVNLLLGRIKMRLINHGVTIQLSTPTTLSGICLKVGPSPRNALCLPHQFLGAGALAQVRLDAVAESDVMLRAEEASVSASLGTEDDNMLMF